MLESLAGFLSLVYGDHRTERGWTGQLPETLQSSVVDRGGNQGPGSHGERCASARVPSAPQSCPHRGRMTPRSFRLRQERSRLACSEDRPRKGQIPIRIREELRHNPLRRCLDPFDPFGAGAGVAGMASLRRSFVLVSSKPRGRVACRVASRPLQGQPLFA